MQKTRTVWVHMVDDNECLPSTETQDVHEIVGGMSICDAHDRRVIQVTQEVLPLDQLRAQLNEWEDGETLRPFVDVIRDILGWTRDGLV
jgi:hypothetical protein